MLGRSRRPFSQALIVQVLKTEESEILELNLDEDLHVVNQPKMMVQLNGVSFVR
jgi:hypothetical protein